MGFRRWIGLLLLSLVGMSLPAHARSDGPLEAVGGGAQAPRPQYDSEPPIDTILVTGQRLRGGAIGDIAPEIQLDEEDIAAFGANSVDELVESLAPQTGAGAARPIVLLNGQRISSFAEVRDLPPEALERIDILPPEVALRYGYRANLRVVNIVLRPRYRAVVGEAAYAMATDGGRSTYQGDGDITRVTPQGRWNLHATYQRAESLLESERDITGGLGQFRSLLPSVSLASLNGTLNSTLSTNVSATFNARLEGRGSRARVGRSGADDRPLIRDTESRTAHLGLAVRGELGGWNWLFTGNYDRSRSVIRTDLRPTPPVASVRPRDVSRFSGHSAAGQLLLYGSLASLPAGDLHTSLRLGLDRERYRSRNTPLSSLPQDFRLSRTQTSGQVTFDVPLLDGGSQRFGALGELSANLDLELNRVSDFGTLHRVSYGGRWSPVRQLSFTAAIAHEEIVPSIDNLGEPPIMTPNVRVFDFTRGVTADVDRIDGGNPSLRAEDRREIRLGMLVQPLSRPNFGITVNYTASRTRRPIAFLPTPTAELETAFPDRFVRDGAGRLLRIDARPVNFDRADREELRWGGTLTIPLGRPRPAGARNAEAPPPVSGDVRERDLHRLTESDEERRGRLQLAMYHRWRFRDEMLIRPGVPRLDFLDGSAVGSRGGRPRHEVELQAGLFRGGLGARLTANWQSGTQVRSVGRNGTNGQTLAFSDHAVVNFRLFASLGEQPALARRAPWLRGSRISLEVENVFNSRPRARDEAGLTPVGLQPAYLDPLGRTVRISFRKLF